MICNILCYLHTILNNCAKYEHHWSKNEGRVRVTNHKLIVSIFDIVFQFDTNGKAVIKNLHSNVHSIDNHCAIHSGVHVMRRIRYFVLT